MAEGALIALLSTRALKIAAWIGCAVTTALALGIILLAIIEPEGSEPAPLAGLGVLALVLTAFGVLGAIVASRQPRNPIGWLLGLIGLSLGILMVTEDLVWQLLVITGDAAGVAAYVAWLHNWMWIAVVLPALTFLPLLFPTGRPLSARWRALVWMAAIAGALMFAGLAFEPGPLASHPAVVNPLGIDSPVLELPGIVAFALLILTTLASIASLVVRFRRSRGTERQQLKWVAAGAVLLAIAFCGASLIGWERLVAFVILLLGLLAVAAAIAVAMLRYRLYDIDVVLNRALVYGALTATLAGIYLASVLLLQLVLSGVTADSSLAVAASTLAVAALFQPARRRIQHAVDRRFYRQKYDAARTLESFGARLRDEVDLDALGAELRAVVAQTMQPQHVSLWLRPADLPPGGQIPSGAGARS